MFLPLIATRFANAAESLDHGDRNDPSFAEKKAAVIARYRSEQETAVEHLNDEQVWQEATRETRAMVADLRAPELREEGELIRDGR